MSNPFTTPAEEVRFRFDEYTSVIDNTAKLSDRRQTINDIFVGLNSLFLTALGFLFISLQLTTWWPTALFVTIAIITTMINNTWLRLNDRYRGLINVRLRYARQLEEYIQSLNVAKITLDVSPKADGSRKVSYFGVLQVEGDSVYNSKNQQFGFSGIEQTLIKTFLWSYIVLAFVIAGLTFAIMNHYLPQLVFKA